MRAGGQGWAGAWALQPGDDYRPKADGALSYSKLSGPAAVMFGDKLHSF